MKQKSTKTTNRNWVLILVASVYALVGLAIAAIAITNISFFGWWSLPIGLAGATPVVAAVTSIIRNDPAWILLDLIIPG